MGRSKKENSSKESKNFSPPKLNLSQETKRGIAVIIFVALALVAVLSLANLAGSLGAQLLKIMTALFGVMAYVIPLILLAVAISLFKQDLSVVEKDRGFYWRVYLGALLLTGSIGGLIHIFYLNNNGSAFALAQAGQGGGYLGAIFSQPLFRFLGFWAGSLILMALIIIAILVTFDVPLKSLLPGKGQTEDETGSAAEQTQPQPLKINAMGKEGFVAEKIVDKNKKLAADGTEEDGEEIKIAAGKAKAAPAVKLQNAAAKNPGLQIEAITLEDRKDWKLPQFDLLDDNRTEVDSGNIEVNVAIIKKTLSDFGIEVEMGEVNVGPTVTQYTLRPATGVKLSQIAGLQNDLALALAAHSLRMELPIPGKALVGIEVPNKSTAIVRLREVMHTKEFVDHKSKLALALGRDVAGHPMIVDLAKMPHLLIAGATGTGKSVSINSLFISLLYRNTPQDVKFIVVDPKRVELNLYNGIPHLLTPVVTENEKAVNALKWAVAEMDRRYKLLSEAGKRNILEYNESAGLSMPYIVILVDELADLMAVAQADVEAAIVRLAQMARAVGIHLVLATQRPSVDIITGLIKANITSRIAFAVASQIDSRTILDTSGAEKLLGNGDMLYTSAEFNKPKRVQGAYVGEKEVKKVVDFFKTQVGAVIYNEEILEKPKKALGIPGLDGEAGEGDDDPLLAEATEEVRRAGKASASLLQRRLRIGYARAARILDILEQKGIIGPGEGAKPREVYGVVPPEEKAEYGIEDEQDPEA
ncbi:MAG TPA: DNA translocase FtsK 4TM domain-containing protein [Patescibacteria group bacterium]|nr:DNA translocase FtsK 4TM domain-containing protein [Patescibacteria group bacterium]